MYFSYGDKELAYLKSKDKRLAAVIDKIGHIDRAVDTDLFSAVVHHIVAQQISTKAQQTIWQRLQDALGEIAPETIGNTEIGKLQSLGMSFRKAEYIKDFADKIIHGEWNLNKNKNICPIDEAIASLILPKGCRRVDSRNDIVVLLAAPQYFQLWRFSDSARYENGLSPPQY